MSSNPFALLEDESADPVVVQKPAKVGKPAAKSAAPKPAPKTASNNSNKANPAKKTFKFVPKAGGQVDSAPFEEAPVHKEGVQTERPIHKGEARRDRHSRAGNFKDSEKKMVAGKGTWGDEMQAQIAEIDEEEELARQKEAELEQSYKSLSQFKSEQQALKLNEKVQVRKANEGADESSFKGTVLEKPQDDVFFAGKAAVQKERKQKKAGKQVLPIEPRQLVREDRPDRPKREYKDKENTKRSEGPKGDKPAKRTEKPASAAKKPAAGVNVANQQDFPSL